MKQLAGMIQDRFWKYASLPDYLHSFPAEPSGGVNITSISFGTRPHPSRPYSPALQHQVSLLTGNKCANCFLFDKFDRPVLFMIEDMYTKISFQNLHSDVLSSPNPIGLVYIAEYLVKMMEHKLGLSRERILVQMNHEYPEDVTEMVVKWEQSPWNLGTTFIEVLSKNMVAAMPRVMDLGK
jgi:hypothetical protein